MPEMINVYNRNKYNIGIKKPDGTEMTIRPGSFVMLTENDINWLNTICDYIPSGQLQLDEAHRYITEQMGIDITESVYAMTDDEIKACLNQSVKKVEDWLEPITDRMLLSKICDVAETMDLTKAKLKLLKDKLPEREMIG